MEIGEGGSNGFGKTELLCSRAPFLLYRSDGTRYFILFHLIHARNVGGRGVKATAFYQYKKTLDVFNVV